MPSRVPMIFAAHGRPIEGMAFGSGQFTAAKDSKPLMEFPDRISEDCLLKVSGFRVDVIKETGIFLTEESLETEQSTNEWLEGFERFCRDINSNVYPRGGPDFLWRIPTMDMEIKSDAYGKPVSSDDGLNPPQSQRASVRMRVGYRALREHSHESVEGPQPVHQDREAYKYALREIVLNRNRGKPFATERNRYTGIGDEHIKAGDLVVIFLGSAAPFVLSEVEPGIFKLGRQCYVHGIMDGELMERNPQIEQFVLS